MIQQILAIWSLVPLPFEEMQRMGSWNPFLKISNYPKTCSTSFPGAECLSLHPEFPVGGAEGQQLQQHKVQSLQRQTANALVVQSLSVRLFVTPWTAALQASQSFSISQSLLKLMTIESVMASNCLCRPPLFLSSIFPASGSFLMSQFFASCGQSIGASASASVLPMNIQGWFPLGLTGLISSSLTLHNYKFIFYICNSVSVL